MKVNISGAVAIDVQMLVNLVLIPVHYCVLNVQMALFYRQVH